MKRSAVLWHRSMLRWGALLSLALFSACLPEPTPVATPLPTATNTVTPTVTETIVWFPATATYTPLPVREVIPTQDMRPVLGEKLFEDPFTDTSFWQTTRTAVGSAAYGKGEFTLAVSQPGGSILSLRKTPQLNNFYLEIDAVPSLCRSDDTFGLLLRAASGQDYYRLSMRCSGQVRMERVKNSRTVPMNEWVTSGQILPGGMLRTRLGVSAQGQEISIFINGVYHFSVKDPVFESGALGVFARSAEDTPLTVNFSNLVVYSLGPARAPLKTPTPTQSATPTRAAPAR